MSRVKHISNLVHLNKPTSINFVKHDVLSQKLFIHRKLAMFRTLLKMDAGSSRNLQNRLQT